MALTKVTTGVLADNSVTAALIDYDPVGADQLASVSIAVGITSVVTATSLTATV